MYFPIIFILIKS